MREHLDAIYAREARQSAQLLAALVHVTDAGWIERGEDLCQRVVETLAQLMPLFNLDLAGEHAVGAFPAPVRMQTVDTLLARIDGLQDETDVLLAEV